MRTKGHPHSRELVTKWTPLHLLFCQQFHYTPWGSGAACRLFQGKNKQVLRGIPGKESEGIGKTGQSKPVKLHIPNCLGSSGRNRTIIIDWLNYTLVKMRKIKSQNQCKINFWKSHVPLRYLLDNYWWTHLRNYICSKHYTECQVWWT